MQTRNLSHMQYWLSLGSFWHMICYLLFFSSLSFDLKNWVRYLFEVIYSFLKNPCLVTDRLVGTFSHSLNKYLFMPQTLVLGRHGQRCKRHLELEKPAAQVGWSIWKRKGRAQRKDISGDCQFWHTGSGVSLSPEGKWQLLVQKGLDGTQGRHSPKLL